MPSQPPAQTQPSRTVTVDEAYTLLAAGTAPEGLRVDGSLSYAAASIDWTGQRVLPLDAPARPLPAAFPARMSVDLLDLTGSEIRDLPPGLKAYELLLSDTPIEMLPVGLQVRSRLELLLCNRLQSLPAGLKAGSLNLRGCTELRRLPENMDVGFLDLRGCHAFEGWPQMANIRGGRLLLGGCTALRELPNYLQRLSALDVSDCVNLTSLPDQLVVTGWIDIAHSGLRDESALPPGLRTTQLRWSGVNIDRRIAFHPEQITIDEVLSERNTERRRVLLDRYGLSRFLEDAESERLDADSDPGGPRQLLRIALDDDEPLVALACSCPSTGRQYMLRVPPQTKTCHQAAAWMAGFDNPDDYRPAIET